MNQLCLSHLFIICDCTLTERWWPTLKTAECAVSAIQGTDSLMCSAFPQEYFVITFSLYSAPSHSLHSIDYNEAFGDIFFFFLTQIFFFGREAHS